MDDASNASNGLINALTGTLSKAVDTALDVYTIKQTSPKSNTVGTAYPTGQTDPASVKSEDSTVEQVKAQTNNIAKYIPWIVGGGVVLVLLFGGIAVLNSRKS